MKDDFLQIQVLYEIAMSIGNEPNLFRMLQKSLSIILRNLNCSAGAVLEYKKEEQNERSIESVFSIPRNIDNLPAYSLALQKILSQSNLSKLSDFTKTLPYVESVDDRFYIHIMELSDFGFLIIIKANSCLEQQLLNSMVPIIKKLAEACIASKQNEKMLQIINELKIENEKRRKAEKNLLKSEQNMSSVLNNTQDAVVRLDKNFRHVFVNSALYEITGLSAEQYLGKTNEEIRFPEELCSFWQKKHESVFQNKKSETFEFNFPTVNKGERRFQASVSPEFNENKDVKSIISFMRDITDRKQVEEALQKSKQRLDDILYGTNSGTWEWNVQTGETSFNERWANIIGYTLHELEPISIQTWIDFVHPDDLKVSNELLEKLFKREIDCYELECRMKHKNGSWVWVLDCGRVISWTDDNKPLMISGTHQDVTRRRQAEAKLMERNQQLQQLQKAESLNRMAGAVAHNFNNQLSVVLGNLELALDDLPGDTEIHEFLNEAIKAAQRSSEISGSMLTYLGQSTIKLEVLNLSEVCRHMLPLLHDTMQKNITLKTDFMVPGPVVVSNANQIQTVLTNLIANSVEAIGDRKGSITLKIKIIPASDIPTIYIAPIDWQPDANIFACLEVKDTGCGISDEDIHKIFDPFFTTKFTGRGLGVSVVLGIVKTWKGAVSVESRKGHGSIFRVFLSLSTNEISWQSEKVIGTDNIEKHGTVLLIDDQNLVRKMVGSRLKRMGFSVLEAAGGFEGVELFVQHREKIRCVITDLSMPEMDGWETLMALRKIQPNLPIILVSGYDEAQAMERFDSEKPQAFLRKPFSKAELEKALNKSLYP